MKPRIIIAGGTGFLGHSIIKGLQQQAEIVVLTRKRSSIKDQVRYVQWDAQSPGSWVNELENSKAIINLVGKSVNCRYTGKNMHEIISSRVNATLAIGKAIGDLHRPPEVWINAGSAAIFGNGGSDIKHEASELGTGFSPEVCKKWEEAFYRFETPATRKVLLRIGLVLQRGTGLLQPFVKLVKLGLGGTMGNGEQYISWIHEEDFINIIRAGIERDDISGTIHCTSPNPVPNKEFLRLLRQSCNVKIGIPHPAFFLKAGAVFAGTEAELLLSGRRVVPGVLEEKNFKFRYAKLEDTFEHLISGSQAIAESP
jgi:uncharacterized protein